MSNDTDILKNGAIELRKILGISDDKSLLEGAKVLIEKHNSIQTELVGKSYDMLLTILQQITENMKLEAALYKTNKKCNRIEELLMASNLKVLLLEKELKDVLSSRPGVSAEVLG